MRYNISYLSSSTPHQHTGTEQLVHVVVTPPVLDNPRDRDRDLVGSVGSTTGLKHHVPPQIGHPFSTPPCFALRSSIDIRNSGILQTSDPPNSTTHFCFASIKRYFRSSNVCSEVFILTNVVASPVFPDRPVRPISWT